jgi:hypothetical protein
VPVGHEKLREPCAEDAVTSQKKDLHRSSRL